MIQHVSNYKHQNISEYLNINLVVNLRQGQGWNNVNVAALPLCACGDGGLASALALAAQFACSAWSARRPRHLSTK